ncbi:Mitochondrial carrier domain protein [Raphanus sativus]|nr:Mitochondrial carrier domain protein [Raphanus sativus]
MEEPNRDTLVAGTMINSPLLFILLLLLKLVPWSAYLTLTQSQSLSLLSQPYYDTFFLSGLPIHKSYLACQNEITASDTSSSNSTILWPIGSAKTNSILHSSKSSFFSRFVNYFTDAFRTIMKEEGPWAFYKGIVPALLLNSRDYAALGGSSKVAAVLLTYPFQQRPSPNGMPRYIDSLHVIRETARFEGLRGFYKGLTANLLKTVPASSITFIVYENVLKRLKQPPTK